MEGIPTTGIILFHNGRVLLVKHKEASGHLNGVYGIPGGRINEGESVEDAAVREMQEETGIVVRKEDLLTYPNNAYTANIMRKDGTFQKFTMTLFLTETFMGNLHIGDETKPLWVDVDSLYLYDLLPNVEKAISDARIWFMQHGKVIATNT